jgi:dihydrofolate synthase / folylpolyglutamate synthase
MSYTEAVSYLYSLGNEVSTMKLGLDNISRLLAVLGDPQTKYFKVQVAGTNGKGSVCAFLDATCIAAGIRTGLFTSPHLVAITERIRIDGRDISEEDFAEHALRVRNTAETLLANGELKYLPTFFEQITAIALSAFADRGVELAILETGLGGRLDATTAANAEIAAITQIDYDHQEYLGDTLAEIAAEKAAILHKDSMAVTAEQHPAAAMVIDERCKEFGIDLRRTTEVKTTYGRGWLNFATEKGEYPVDKLGLLGAHQVENAKLSILITELLKGRFPFSKQNVIDGLQNAHHSGRLEVQGNLLFDGAHNAAGAKALAKYLDSIPGKPITLVFGVMQGKNVSQIAELLFSRSKDVVLTMPNNTRALSPEQIIELLPEPLKLPNIMSTRSVNEAINIAKRLAGDDGIILITGSLYLVGEAKKILNN